LLYNHYICWCASPLITKHWLIRGTLVSVYIDHVTYFNRTTTVTNLTRAYNTIRIPCPETRLFRVSFKWYKQAPYSPSLQHRTRYYRRGVAGTLFNTDLLLLFSSRPLTMNSFRRHSWPLISKAAYVNRYLDKNLDEVRTDLGPG
jgi:hypothetical protein